MENKERGQSAGPIGDAEQSLSEAVFELLGAFGLMALCLLAAWLVMA